MFNKSQGKMKKILEKSGKSQGISSEEKSGNPVLYMCIKIPVDMGSNVALKTFQIT